MVGHKRDWPMEQNCLVNNLLLLHQMTCDKSAKDHWVGIGWSIQQMLLENGYLYGKQILTFTSYQP